MPNPSLERTRHGMPWQPAQLERLGSRNAIAAAVRREAQRMTRREALCGASLEAMRRIRSRSSGSLGEHLPEVRSNPLLRIRP